MRIPLMLCRMEQYFCFLERSSLPGRRIAPFQVLLCLLLAIPSLLTVGEAASMNSSLRHTAPPQRATKPGNVCHASLFPHESPLLQQRELLLSVEQQLPPAAPQKPVARHPAFRKISQRYLQEYSMRVVEYRHSSGVSVWSLEVPEAETEMTFSICFRTPVADSFGTPHILEHSVLMGSEKFPVPSIFKYLASSSLNTFLNAATWPDRTCYHFASLNEKDFYNLLEVYMDAVFRPLLLREPLVFKQEGWHYELSSKSNLNGESSPVDCAVQRDLCDLRFSGVVYSEMKGRKAEVEVQEEFYRFKELFPDLPTYAERSGGEPESIPSLSYEHLIQFYRQHYTPENSWIVFYGPDEVAKRLKAVDDYISTYLTTPRRRQPRVVIGTQKAFAGAARGALCLVEGALYRASKLKAEVNGRCEEFDAQRMVELKVLEYLLTGTEQSPLYKALNESGFGAVVHVPGLDFEARHAVYAVGLKEVKHEDGVAAQIEALVLETMASLVSSGFREEEVAAAINSVEFRLREFRRGSVPRGLSFTRLMAEQLNFGRDPLLSLEFMEPIRRIREEVVRGSKLFEHLLEAYFLTNTHRLQLRLKASKTMAAEVAANEQRRLEEIKASMSSEELAGIVKEQQALSDMQVAEQNEEALATLPKLSREDINPNGEEIPIEVTAVAKVPLLTHELPSSGVVYVDVGVSLADLSLDDVNYLPLLAAMIEEAGTSELKAGVLHPLRGQKLGGIGASFTFRPAPQKPLTIPDPYDARGLLMLSGKATSQHAVDLWCFLHVMLVDANFSDGKTGVRLIKKLISEREESFHSSPFYVAIRLARSSFGVSAFADETTRGYRSLLFYKKLLAQAEADWSTVAARLSGILDRLLVRRNLILNVTGDASSLKSATTGVAREVLLGLIKAMPDSQDKPAKFTANSGLGSEALDQEPLWGRNIRDDHLLSTTRAAYTTASRVNDVALVTPLSPPGSPFLGSYLVGFARMESLYLHTQVRDLSGAYGAVSRYCRSGLITFASYSDPKPAATLRTFRGSPAFLESWAKSSDEAAILEALIRVVSDLDHPKDIDVKGTTSLWQFIDRETAEDRSTLRSQVLKTTPEELLHLAIRLKDSLEAKVEAVTLIGPESEAKEVLKGGESLELVTVA